MHTVTQSQSSFISPQDGDQQLHIQHHRHHECMHPAQPSGTFSRRHNRTEPPLGSWSDSSHQYGMWDGSHQMGMLEFQHSYCGFPDQIDTSSTQYSAGATLYNGIDTNASPRILLPLYLLSPVPVVYSSSSCSSNETPKILDINFGGSLPISPVLQGTPSFEFNENCTYRHPHFQTSPSAPPSPSSSSGFQALEIHPGTKRPFPASTTVNKPSCASVPEDSSRRRFPCLTLGCARRFTSQYTLKIHMEAHKPKPRVVFPCTLGCNERFSRQHDRLRHEVAKHNKVCEFSCDACSRFFSSKKTLTNHKCPVALAGTRWVHL